MIVLYKPVSPARGTDWLIRGGSWYSGIGNLRGAVRGHRESMLFRGYNLGFRLVLRRRSK